jgi:ketosteroid isomerase-like protein
MKELETLVRDLIRAWREGRYEDLERFFHPDAVLLPPEGAPIVGRAPLVESYREFDSVAVVHEFTAHEVIAHAFGGTAVAHMRFGIDYEIDGGRSRESGIEVYAIDTSGSEPLVVWRTQIPSGDGRVR